MDETEAAEDKIASLLVNGLQIWSMKQFVTCSRCSEANLEFTKHLFNFDLTRRLVETPCASDSSKKKYQNIHYFRESASFKNHF